MYGDVMKKVLKTVIFLLLAIWVISILKCEVLTLLYKNNYKEIPYFEDIDRMRVLNRTSDTARVYYIVEDNELGIVVNFSKNNGKWFFDNYDCVWSEQGNADSYIWPYGR